MSQNFYNNLVLAMLGPQANPADPSVALSPQLLYTYKALAAEEADLFKAFNSVESKRKIAELGNQVKIYRSAQNAAIDAMSVAAQNKRVSSQNIARMKIAAQNNATKARLKNTEVDESKVRDIIRQGQSRARASNEQDPRKQIVLEALTTTYLSTDPLDPDNTRANGTINEILLDTVGSDLNKPTELYNKLEDMFADSSLREEVMDAAALRVRAAQANQNTINVANRFNSDLSSYEEAIKGVVAGSSTEEAQLQVQNALMAQALKNYSQTLTTAANTSDAALAAVREFYDRGMSKSLQYAQVSGTIADTIIGRDPSGDYRGGLVGNPNFMAWAKDNGYNNLGYMSGGVYVEGADDTDAIYMFNYQRMNPDKYRPGIRRDLGDTGVTVKIERKASPAEMNQYLRAGDGTFFTYKAADGTNKYLKKDSDIINIVKKGGVKVKGEDGTTLIIDVNYEDLNDSSSNLYKLIDGLGYAEKAKSMFNTDKAKFKKGLGQDLVKVLLTEPVVRDEETGIVDEKETFKRLSRIKALNVVAVDAQGIVSAPAVSDLEDMLDGYAVDQKANNLDFMQPGADTFSKLIGTEENGKWRSGEAVGITAFVEKVPVTTSFAEVKVPHAADFDKDGLRIKIEDANGVAYLDKNQTIVESTSASLLPGVQAFRAKRMEDPEKRFNFAKKVETGFDPSELEVKEVAPISTEEEYEKEATESYVNALMPTAKALYRRQEAEKKKEKKKEKVETVPVVEILEGLKLPANLFDDKVVAAAQQKAFEDLAEREDIDGRLYPEDDISAEEQQEIGKGLLQEQYNLMIKGGAEPIEAASALGMLPVLAPMPPVSPEPFEASLTPRARRQRRREDIRSIAEQMAATGTVPTSRRGRIARFRDLELPVFQDPRAPAPESFTGMQEKTIQQPEDILTGDRAEDKEGIVIAGTSGRSLERDKTTGKPFESSRVLVKGSAPTSSEDREIIAATLGERADIAAAASGLGAGSKAKDSRIIYSDAIAARELAKKRKPKGEEESAEAYEKRIAAETAKIERRLDPKEFNTSF